MNGSRGYTVLELLVAAAVLLGVLASVSTLLYDGLADAPVLEEAADLHQRGRVAFDALAADIRAAGAGGRAGPLTAAVAAVLPRSPGAPATSVQPGVITVRYAVPAGASSILLTDLVPGVSLVEIDLSAGCPETSAACGFVTGTRAMVFDAAGHWDLLSVEAIGAGALSVTDVRGPRTVTYHAGTWIVEAAEVAYAFDAAARTLRRTEGSASFPLVDHVAALRFELLDETLNPFAAATLVDGPFRGTGSNAFDLDLLRVRQVRAILRLETSLDRLRGSDPRLFARPGTATGIRTLPDVVMTVDAGLRNAAR